MTKDVERLLLHLVDVVWQDVYEDESVPSTRHAKKLIQKAKDTIGEFKDWRLDSDS